MKLLKIQFLLIFAGLLLASPAFAEPSARGCDTNTMKNGEFCNWAEGKSWCAGNTLTCAVESTTPCPANPANGTYAFSCNSNSCVLSCNSGYTNCSGTCTLNGSMPNCTTYNTCAGTCTTCAPGYTWNGSSCAAATLKLGSTSVSGATGVVQAATNPQLFISGTTIGLGISNPTANLHLVSNTNTEGLRIVSSNYSPFIIRNTADTEDLFRIDQDGNITSKGSLTGSNSFWNIDGSNLYASSTTWNVGIGITNPTEKLTVVGAINSNSTVNGTSLCIAGDCKTSWGDAGWSFDGNTVGQVKSFGTLDNYAIPFLSNGVERMRLTETGNFVIGATSTGVRLHVESPQGAVAFFKSNLNGGSYAGYIGNGQTFTGEEFGLYYALNDQRMATYNLTNSLLLYGGHLSSDAALAINAAGYVGVGLTNPGAKLEVLGTFRVNGALNSVVLDRLSGTGNRIVMADASGSLYATSSAAATGLPEGTSGQTLRHDGTKWLANSVLYNNGVNIGIGTATPTTKLQLYSSGYGAATGLSFGDGDTGIYEGSDDIMYFGVNGASSAGFTATGMFAGAGSAGNAYLLKQVSSNVLPVYSFVGDTTTGVGRAGASVGSLIAGGVNVLNWNNSGNVGIGTTSPSQKLVVNDGNIHINTPNNSAGGNGVRLNRPGATYAGFEIATNNTVDWSIGANSAGFGIYEDGLAASTRLIIKEGGNIGINTTNPGAKLEVVGTLRVNGALNSVVLDRLSGTGNRIVMTDASGSLYATSSSVASGLPGGSTGQTLRSDGTSWLANSTIYNNGTNVGIGVVPTTKLDVNGNLAVRGDNIILGSSDENASQSGLIDGDVYPYVMRFKINTDDSGYSWGWTHRKVSDGTETHAMLLTASAARATLRVDSNITAGPLTGAIGTIPAQTTYVKLGAAGASETSYFNAGNVGIGTTSPLFKLHLAGGDLRSEGTFRTGVSGQPGRWRFYDSSGYLMSFWNGTTDYDTWGLSWDTTDNEFRWMGNGTLRSSIDLDDGSAYFQGNVGIGTSTPAAQLSVSGGNIFINDAVINSGTPKAAITWEYLNSALSPFAPSWVLSGSNLYASSTSWNVGIGTVTPQSKLDVAGVIRAGDFTSTSGSLILAGQYSGTQYVNTLGGHYSSAGTVLGYAVKPKNGAAGYVSSADNIAWSRAAINLDGGLHILTGVSQAVAIGSDVAMTERLTILNSGNVGINKTNPGYTLDVNGSINATSILINGTPVGGGGSQWTTAGSNIYYNTGNVGIGTTTPSDVLSISTSSAAYAGLRITNSNGTGWAGAYVKLDNNQNSSMMLKANSNYTGFKNMQANDLILYNESGNTSFYNNVGNINFIAGGGASIQAIINTAGNVGIGTTSPASKLSVSGGNILINDAVVNSGTPKAAITWEYLDSALSSLGSTGNWVLNGSNLYASSTGWNVGIGTTNPGYKLDVNGIIKTNNRIMVESGNGTVAMFLADEYGVSESGLYSGGGYRIATYHDYDSAFQYADGSIYVSSGNVGIGTTTPSDKLSVSGGNILINDAVVNSGTPKAAITWEYLNSALSSLGSTGNWALSGSNLYASSTTWNVGIGTTTPSQKLTVAGNALIDAGNMLYFRDTTTYINEGSGLNIVAGNSRSLNLAGGTGTDLTITSAGNVGIGTTTPGAKLEVSGNIRTTVDNALPNFVMDSSSAGDNWTSQGAYISLGESGSLGSAALHLTYIGNGTSYVGSGAVTAGVPAQSYLRFAYDSKNIYTDSNLQNAATGNSYFMGNLGVGISNPGSYKLNVTGNSYLNGTVTATGVVAANAGLSQDGNTVLNGTDTWLRTTGATGWYSATYGGGWYMTDSTWIRNYSTNKPLYITGNNTYSAVFMSGGVGIGTTTPAAQLSVSGGNILINDAVVNSGTPKAAVTWEYLNSALSSLGSTGNWALSGSNLYASSTTWNVGIGTTSPTAKLHVIGNAIISTSLTMGGDINMGSNNITNLTKLTVNTIDPLYNIKGVNYSTFAASVVGGVKEEYVGRIKLTRLIDNGEYEAVVDFDQVKEGSDLWVWRHTVDFSADNVQVLITPYGGFAEVYYQINGNSLVLRADRPADISYRLIGKRLDWRQWPTRAKDQEEKAGFVID